VPRGGRTDQTNPSSSPAMVPHPALPATEACSDYGDNQMAAANLIDAVQLDARAANLVSFLDTEPFANLPNDLQKISPDGLTSFYEIGFSNANIQKLTLEGRLNDIHNGLNGFSSNSLAPLAIHSDSAESLRDRASIDQFPLFYPNSFGHRTTDTPGAGHRAQSASSFSTCAPEALKSSRRLLLCSPLSGDRRWLSDEFSPFRVPFPG
jgi:hypothetical protein